MLTIHTLGINLYFKISFSKANVAEYKNSARNLVSKTA